MPNLALLRSTLTAGLALSLPVLSALPATAQFLPPGADTQVIENLAELPNIPIEDFPDVILTQEIIDQFAAVGTPLPPDAQPGMAVMAEDLFRIGNFDPFGLPDASFENLAAATGVSTDDVSLAEVEPILEMLSLDDLVNQLGGLEDALVVDVPAVRALLVETLFEGLRLQRGSGLTQLGRQLNLKDGNLSGLLSNLREGLAPGDILDPDSLPIEFDITQGLGNFDGIFAPELNERLLQQTLGDLTVGELASTFPAVREIPLSNLSPELLQNISLKDSVPNLTRLAIGRIDGIEALPLSSFGALNVQSLSLGQMPDPMQLVGGVRFGVADVALGDPGSGSSEQQRLRVVSGGITSKNKQLTARRCTDNDCPHFEISDPGHSAYNGAAWMDGSTQVSDGFGLLCRPFGCKGPTGNHPFGSGVRVQLRNIDQASGTAQVTLSFAYCRRIPFVGKTCSPWVFPMSSGIPIGTIREQTILPYAPPSNVK